MIRALKSYWAYGSAWYKLVMLVGVPIVWVVGYVLMVEENAGIGLIQLCVLVMLDAVSDFFFMNGVYRKGGALSNFMQSSSKFPRIMKEVATVDIIRRMLVLHIPLGMEVMYAWGDEESMLGCETMASWTWGMLFTAQLVVFIARHFNEWVKSYACVTIGFIVMSYLAVVFSMIGTISEFFGESVISYIVVFFMVAFLIMSIVTVWYTGKKAKECYYD